MQLSPRQTGGIIILKVLHSWDQTHESHMVKVLHYNKGDLTIPTIISSEVREFILLHAVMLMHNAFQKSM